MAYRIDIDEAPGDAVRRVAAERVGSALEAAGNREAPVAERIHDVRKRCKQTRSLVRLVRSGFSDYKRVNKSFRLIATRVCAHRDARVMADLVHKLAAIDQSESPDDNPVVRWFAFRAGMAEEVAAPVLSGIHALLAEAADDLGRWPVSDIRVDDVVEGLWQTLARVHATTQEVREGGPLHEWRKRCKDLWYQLRVLENALPCNKRHYIQHLDVLTELIGDAHDCQLLIGHLDEQPPFLADTTQASRIAGVAMQQRDDLRDKALVLSDELLELSPEELTDSVIENWRPKTGVEPRFSVETDQGVQKMQGSNRG